MDVKMPFIPEETLRTQRVEIYLNDLKERLKGLRLQHDEVIQNSVDIIKEIDEVGSSLLLPQNVSGKNDENISKIKKLIQEFETAKETSSAKTPVAIESKVNIQKILQNFEQLNDSHVLKDSLMLFKRAKESFEKIDHFFGKINILNAAVPAEESKAAASSEHDTSSDLKHKITLFNGGAERHKDSPSRYASCCSSVMSIDTFHSTEELCNVAKAEPSTTNSLENGYEGDNDDSEYDLFAIKKKKSKFLPPNM